jgi:methionyl-tRNA formyltransferase
MDGEQLRIYAASAQYGNDTSNVGTVINTEDGAITIQCGKGRLAITELQRPGKKPVSARDLANSISLVGKRLG